MPLEINGEFIEDALLDEEYQHILAQYKQRQREEPSLQIPSLAALHTLVKENVSRRFLLLQEAEKRGIQISSQSLDSNMAKLLASRPDIQNLPAAEQQQIAEYAKKKLKTEKLLHEVSKDINPIESHHVSDFYASNQEHYRREERLHFLYLAEKNTLTMGQHISKPIAHIVQACKDAPSKQRAEVFRSLSATYTDASQNKDLLFGEYKSAQRKDIASQLHTPLFSARLLHAFPYLLSPYQYSFLLLKKHAAGIAQLDEIYDLVYHDLLAEIKERKIDAFTASLMLQSKIVDHRSL